MRHIKQRNGYTCAPVAILNLAKWAGWRVTHRDIPRWARKCKTSPKTGSDIKHYGKVLKRMPGIKIRVRNNTSVADIDRELSKGNAVVIRYASRNNVHEDVMLDTFSKHIFVITKRNDTSFYCTNVSNGHHWVLKELFASICLDTTLMGYPKVWYARKSP